MFIVMTIEDNIPKDILHVSSDLNKATEVFKQNLKTYMPEWLKMYGSERKDVIDEGYLSSDNRCICIIDTSNYENYND